MLSFIVQARLGSTRLPGKILLPFHDGKSIFELMLDKLKSIPGTDCIVATSESPVNDPLQEICRTAGVKCFRGSEDDVLQRFIDAACFYGADRIIRVCSDNPFLNVPAILQLIDTAGGSDADYIGFDVDGTPSIKTHYGFWTEYVTLDALRMVKELTAEKIYHEHVTNFIYSHREVFRTQWIPVPGCILEHKDTRLTIDTAQDFETARRIFDAVGDDGSFESLFGYLDVHPEIQQSMKVQILSNSK